MFTLSPHTPAVGERVSAAMPELDGHIVEITDEWITISWQSGSVNRLTFPQFALACERAKGGAWRLARFFDPAA